MDRPESFPDKNPEIKTSDMDAKDYIKQWLDPSLKHSSTLAQYIVDTRHHESDLGNRLSQLCLDSPIIEAEVYELLIKDPLFNEMQNYRNDNVRNSEFKYQYEAVRVLMLLEAYVINDPDSYQDITLTFKRVTSEN